MRVSVSGRWLLEESRWPKPSSCRLTRETRYRVLRQGGRVLFTDPLTVSGMIQREEMLIRSGSLGEQVFPPPGIDERLLRAVGFDELRVEDVIETWRPCPPQDVERALVMRPNSMSVRAHKRGPITISTCESWSFSRPKGG